MRTHSISSLPRRGVAVIVLALAFTACSRSHDELASTTHVGHTSAVRGAVLSLAPGTAPTANDKTIDEAAPVAQRAGSSAVTPAPEVALAGGSLVGTSDPSGAMLVRTGQASIEVRRVEDALARTRQTAGQFGGFVANTALQIGKDEQHSATLELRVPTIQFDALLGALGTLGRVESVTANAQDVGEEYVDLAARAANARHTEARLTELLATRTGKLSEVLTVEQEMKRVREEIERYDARLRWLEHRTATSTLTVTLHEPLGLIDRPRPGPLVEALGLAWERMLSVIAWCIASLGLLVPLGVLLGAGALIARRFHLPLFRAAAGHAGADRV